MSAGWLWMMWHRARGHRASRWGFGWACNEPCDRDYAGWRHFA